MDQLIIVFITVGIFLVMYAIHLIRKLDKRLDQWEFYLHTHPYKLTTKKDIDGPPEP